MQYFPKNEDGVILTIIKRLKIIVVPKNEYVFKKGEMASEMYFIIEGKAEVVSGEDKIIALLNEKDYFGEMGILEEKASIRKASIRAVTDLSLAMFSLEDFTFIMQKYPCILKYMKKTAASGYKKSENESERGKTIVEKGNLVLSFKLQERETLNVRRSSMFEKSSIMSKQSITSRDSQVSFLVKKSSIAPGFIPPRFSFKTNNLQMPARSRLSLSIGEEKGLMKSPPPTEFSFGKIAKKSMSISTSTGFQFTDIASFKKNRVEIGSFVKSPKQSKQEMSIPELPDYNQPISEESYSDSSSSGENIVDSNRPLNNEKEMYLNPEQKGSILNFLTKGDTLLNDLNKSKSDSRFEVCKENFEVSKVSVSSKNSSFLDNSQTIKNLLEIEEEKQEKGNLPKLSLEVPPVLPNNSEKFISRTSSPNKLISKGEMDSEDSNMLDVGFFENSDLPLFNESQFQKTEISTIENLKVSDLWNALKKRFYEKLNEIWNSIFSFYTILLMNAFYSVIAYPLIMAFDSLRFQGVLLIIEIISNLIIYFAFGLKFKKIIDKNKKVFVKKMGENRERKSKFITTMKLFTPKKSSVLRLVKNFKKNRIEWVMLIFLIPPFMLFFDALDVPKRNSNIILIILQLLRMSSIIIIFNFLDKLKAKFKAFGRILEVVILYALMAHFIACMFIVVGKIETDFNKMWFAKIPAPQTNFPNNQRDILEISDYSIYIHSLYWTYVTTSHVGMGDVSAINLMEKMYSVAVIFVSILTTIYFFGNLVSVIEDLSPAMKSQLQKSFKKVCDVLRDQKIYGFNTKIEDYFAFIWKNSRGIDENEILSKFPDSLKSDLQFYRYSNIIINSKFFRTFSSSTNIPLATSILKVLSYDIYIQDEPILIAGQDCDNLYLMLEGSADILNLDLVDIGKVSPGQFFGALEGGNSINNCHVISGTVSKIGIINSVDLQRLRDAFPEWGKRLYSQGKFFSKKALENLAFFKENFADMSSQKMFEFYSTNIATIIESMTPYVNRTDSQQFSRIHSQIESLLRSRETKRMNSKVIAPQGNKPKETIKRSNSKKLSFILSKVSEKLEFTEYKEVFIKASILHLLLIIYSTFFLPIYAGFNVPNLPSVIVIEILVTFEAIFYFFLQLKIYYMQKDNYGNREIGVSFTSFSDLCLDFFGIIPMNLIISPFDNDQNFALTIFRMSRVLLIIRVPTILEVIESKYRRWNNSIEFFKTFILLMYVWHWTSCAWFSFNLHMEKSEAISWINKLKLKELSYPFQYIYSSMFVLNIATTTGYPEYIVYNNNERILLILIVYVGNALFGIAFGLLSNFVGFLPQKYLEIYENSM